MVTLNNDWDEVLKGEFEKEYYQKLRGFLAAEYRERSVYPPMHDIFNALKLTPYQSVKVVILGQDPYVGAGQAHGLCFSVPEGVKAPPSLVNIFKEIKADVGADCKRACLTCWAKQGVLLLNTALTVRAGEPNSHRMRGWEILTDKIISVLNERETPMVFMLWGANAKSKKPLIDAVGENGPRHLILEAAHPSPMSVFSGFFGCGHFSKANAFLVKNGMEPIDWST